MWVNQGKRLHQWEKAATQQEQRTALLFWENLTKFLMEELGFTVNPYDHGKQNH
jgi:hypothetical protein